jgi:hypothetical protein
MFDRIAVHYDKVNWFISLGQVRGLCGSWRRGDREPEKVGFSGTHTRDVRTQMTDRGC